MSNNEDEMDNKKLTFFAIGIAILIFLTSCFYGVYSTALYEKQTAEINVYTYVLLANSSSQLHNQTLPNQTDEGKIAQMWLNHSENLSSLHQKNCAFAICLFDASIFAILCILVPFFVQKRISEMLSKIFFFFFLLCIGAFISFVHLYFLAFFILLLFIILQYNAFKEGEFLKKYKVDPKILGFLILILFVSFSYFVYLDHLDCFYYQCSNYLNPGYWLKLSFLHCCPQDYICTKFIENTSWLNFTEKTRCPVCL